MPAGTIHRVDTDCTTLILAEQDGRLALPYIGTRLPENLRDDSVLTASAPVIPHGELDRPAIEAAFPTCEGRPRALPALRLRRDGHELLIDMRVVSWHRQEAGLRVELGDPLAAVGVTLTVSAINGLLQIATAVHNRGDSPIDVDWLASAHLPLEADLTRVRTFGGFWANEFQARETALGDGLLSWGSDRGRSSHGSAAALVAMGDRTGEAQGPALLVMLQWPGNHGLLAGRCDGGGHALQAGLDLAPGELRLAPGESHSAPPVLTAWSDQGLNVLRHQVRAYWQATLKPCERPVHFNSWEACYFDHDEASTLTLIQQAAGLGAERFVLDDGWMAGRSAAGVGLGDWQACRQRYPNGLAPIAAAARAAGLEFGLWVEPESVTLDSELARSHPDWLIGVPQRAAIAGRGQYLLNLGRADVQAYLGATLDRLVNECAPQYIKWDMNRDYAQIGAASGSSALAMTRGWMDLAAAFRKRHPDVAFELCGAGGARSDAGAMHLADRLWPTDSIDPLQRFSVLRQASLLLPPSRLGWHIGAAPAHTSGAAHPIATRCILALLGHPGLEVRPSALSDEDRNTIRAWLEFYRAHRDWLAQAQQSWLDTQPGEAEALLLHDASADRALLLLVQTAYPRRGSTPRLTLPALAGDRSYRVRLMNPDDAGFAQVLPAWTDAAATVFSGGLLSTVGLRVPPLRLGHCALFALDAE